MTVEELFDGGHLADAIQLQNAAVKEHPADTDHRYTLFVLLCFAGELKRAKLQLDTIELQDPSLASGIVVYRGLLAAESERGRVYREGATPLLPPDPPAHLTESLRGFEALVRGDVGVAQTALAAARSSRPQCRGRLNGKPFAGLRDYDDSLGSVLEVYAGGRYLWMPLDWIRKLEARQPDRLIDLLWIQAHLQDYRGTAADVYVPALYEGSTGHTDENIRLGRATAWDDCDGVAFRGKGQREFVLTMDGDQEEELGVLEVRTLEIDSPADEACSKERCP